MKDKSNKNLIDSLLVAGYYYIFSQYGKVNLNETLNTISEKYLQDLSLRKLVEPDLPKCPNCKFTLYENIENNRCEISSCSCFRYLTLECLNEDCNFKSCRGAL